MAKQGEASGAGKGAFEVRVPDGSLATGHWPLVFDRNGVAHTDDPVRAHACLEIPGCTVTRDGKPWPEPVKATGP